MPARPGPHARRAGPVGARAVLTVLTVLVALFAMHGLPMQQPGTMAMTPTVATSATPEGLAGTAVARTAVVGTVVALPVMACGSADHCAATLREAGAPTVAPDVVAPGGSTRPWQAAPSRSDHAPAPTRPPDLSTLQISRT